MNLLRPTKKDVVAALEPLKTIVRPEMDNEGDPLNSPSVYKHLSPDDQARVNHAEMVASDYLRSPGDCGDKPNNRSITELKEAGFPSSLQCDRDDPYRLIGCIEVGDHVLDISDPTNPEGDD